MKSLAHGSSSLSKTYTTHEGSCSKPASAYCYWVPTGITGMPMLTRRVPTSSMTPWYLQVASTCARGTFVRMLPWLVSVFFFMFFDIFQVAKEHSPSYELALIRIGTLRRDSLVVVYSYLYLPMHFASLIQRIWYKPIRPHLIAKENTRVGLLDSRSWWSHAQPAAPLGLTWTCHYPEERAANHPGPVRCIAVRGLERRKATTEPLKKKLSHLIMYTSWLIGFPTMGYHNPQQTR